MLLNNDGMENIILISSAKFGFLNKLAPQELNRLAEAILSRLSFLVESKEYDFKNDKQQWIKLSQNEVFQEVESMGEFMGIKDFSTKVDSLALVNMVYDVEFNTDEFLKNNS